MIGIYAIINTETDTVYYGQSKDINERLRKHKELLRRTAHSNIHLQRSWNKYGENVFKFRPVLLTEDLTHFETALVKKAKNKGLKVFNIREPESKAPLTEEDRKRLSDSHKGKKHSEETKAKMSASHKGIIPSKETRDRMSKALMGKAVGRKLSAEVKEKISKRLIGNKNALGFKHSEEMNKRKSVISKNNWVRRKAAKMIST